MNIIIRPEKPGEAEVSTAILREAFGREDEAARLAALRSSGDFLPPLSLLADCEGQLMGYALFCRMSVQAPAIAHPGLALVLLGVRPQHQRQGAGERLVRHGLERCRSVVPGLVVAFGPSAFFSRFGFRPARAEGLETDFAVPDDAFQVIDLEGKLLGAVKGKVLFPRAFSG